MLRWIVVIVGLMSASLLHAQNYSERKVLSDTYATFKKDNFSILQAPPITHLVPNFNTIKYAFSYEKIDTRVNFPITDPNVSFNHPEEYLHFTGYTFAPHLAISLKKVGIGFSIENSKHESLYFMGQTGYPREQKSAISSSGIGLNLSFLPFEKLRKEYKLAVIAGGKSLNVKHKWTSFYNPDNSIQSPLTEYSTSYTVLRYQTGLNFTMKLLKQFSAIPWVDYSMTDLSAAEAAVQVDPSRPWDESAQTFQDDVQNFWNRDPNFRYGIDLSLRIMNLDLRLGSALGAIGHLNATPDYIIDKTFTLSLSFDQSGG